MKKLTKLLLIHWHYFTRECIEFEELNFLTGKNASGKSTVIDALQLVLLGDTSGNFFNKAASGRGNRTLKGYLQGELGDDENSGFKYLRTGRFTSYIALEFVDDQKQKLFTAGCCFDVYGDNDSTKLFFIYDGGIPEHEFIVNGTPMEIATLRGFLRSKYPGHKSTGVSRDFRETLYGKLGGLRDRFGHLLKKAVSFNPNVDIQQFISEFVCDTPQVVDVSRMQDNIRSYKQLENEANLLKKKIDSLQKIIEVYQSYQKYKQDEMLYGYLIAQAKVDICKHNLSKERDYVQGLTTEINKLEELIGNKENRLEVQSNNLQEALIRLNSNETAQTLKQIENQIEEKQQQVGVLRANYAKAVEILRDYITLWRNNALVISQKLNSVEQNLFNQQLRLLIDNLCKYADDFLNHAGLMSAFNREEILELGVSNIITGATLARELQQDASDLLSRIEEEHGCLREQIKELTQELFHLESGVYKFPQDALELKNSIIARLHNIGKDAKVVIVAEAAEINDQRWQNTIEGYLHTQKFYIIVPPEFFQLSLRVFDSIKRQKKIYGTGIVDIEKLKHKNPTVDVGTLAEEIKTQDANVRVFLDFALGRVRKCDRVTDLRRFKVAVTDEGVLYQNFVVRAMNPERWSKPAIGQSAILMRLTAVRQELEAINNKISVYEDIKNALKVIKGLAILSQTEAQQIVESSTKMADVDLLESNLTDLRKSRDAIDQSDINELRELIIQQEQQIRVLKGEIDKDKATHSTKIEKKRARLEEKLPAMETELIDNEVSIGNTYDMEWMVDNGGVRYNKELKNRGSAEEIYRAFPRELNRSIKSRGESRESLFTMRSEYNTRYNMGYDTKSEDNAAYDDALREFSENKLPEYLSKIEDTRQKAFEQFQEDFLSRLQKNIYDAQKQIDDLNIAIKDSSFGDERFRFRITPKPEYKQYYDMIVDPMLLEGYNLLSDHFNAKYKDEIAELFALISNDETSSKGSSFDDYEKRVQIYTDYKTYLDFDLESINCEGEAQRLSKTMGKKSGGETQTPFYIAVLASFAQLYRIGRDKKANTARLIIFDEAFSKMDGERIIQSIALLRKFNFQVILSAPTEKIADIGTLVDRNLCVLREGKHTCVRAFDPKRLEETLYNG